MVAAVLLALSFLLLAGASTNAVPIAQDSVRVVDGDTIDAYGKRVRLVGFDTPEPQALCEAERGLAGRATARLQQLVDGGGLDL